MPSPSLILAAATAVANDWQALAVVWHLLLAALLIAMLAGWDPGSRLLGYLLTTPLLSVSVLAWVSGNPFSGLIFALLAFTLAWIAHGSSSRPIRIVHSWMLGPGALLVVFGWMYPHFLATDRWIRYAYAAPFGLLPCPTLIVVIGLTLMLGMHRSKPWSATLLVAGLIYGLIGVFQLGVALDYVLLAGSAMLAAATLIDSVEYNPGPHAPNHRGRPRLDPPARPGPGAAASSSIR